MLVGLVASMSELPFYVQTATLAILIATAVVWPIARYFNSKRPMKIEGFFLLYPADLRKPSDPPEQRSSKIVAPKGRLARIYHTIVTKDRRRLKATIVDVTYPEGFEIIRDPTIQGKRALLRGLQYFRDNKVRLNKEDFPSPLGASGVTNISFPLLVKIPNVVGDFSVQIDFGSSSVRAANVTLDLSLSTTDSEAQLSHPASYFA
jgi:hypothetical protein